MARQRQLDDTDHYIMEVIQAYCASEGKGPSYEHIAQKTRLKLSKVYYRVNVKLVGAGLVKHDPWGRGTLEVIAQQ